MSEQKLVIRSLSRTSASASSSDFTINFPQSYDLRGGTKLKLLSFQMYNTLFNVTASNNTLDFNEDSTDKAITAITPGSYDANTLVSAIATALTTASSGYNTYTGSYSSITRKMTFSASNPFTLKFATGASTATSLWKQCGFTSSNGKAAADSSTGTSCSSPYPVNLALPMSLYMQFPELSAGSLNSDGAMFSFWIPLTTSSGSIISYYVNETMCQTVDVGLQTILQRLQVKLLSANGQAADLNGSEFEMVLQSI